MNTVTNYLEKLGSNFFVSAMVPALALVLASILVFDPILKVANRFWNPESTHQLISFGVLIAVITIIIGFTLTALNTYILKMFEGYVIFSPFRFLFNKNHNIHRQKARNLLHHRNRLENKILQLEERYRDHPTEPQELEELRDKYYKSAADYSLQYPEDLDDVLPTRFGNTLKAAENYSGERYGFDGVHFWPRLVQVIPTEYKQTIDHTRDELSFLVNMSVLSVTFSALCILAFFYSMFATNVGSTDATIFIQFVETAAKYLLAAALGFISCWFFYNASIFSVGSFGLMIRASFDLFRLDLLEKLELMRPKNSVEEFETWQNINELVVLGDHSLKFTKLKYRPKEKP